MNGFCGERDAPHRLPLLVGPSVARCPVGMSLGDPEVLELATKVPSPGRAGSLDGIPLQVLPNREREAVQMARGWLKMWEAAHG